MEPTPEATAVADQYLLWRRSLLERVVAFISALDFAVHLNMDWDGVMGLCVIKWTI